MPNQLLQSLKTGETLITEIPCPVVNKNQLLIQTRVSLISAGTERMLVEFGKGSWFDKARQQPDKVKAAIEKIKTDGLLATLDAVKSKLDQALPMGYSNVGVVVELGEGVESFTVGDRVISNAPHAEMVCASKNLCAKIPDTVSDEHAAFTVLGAIALQGVRLAEPTLGECFVVIGLGLIGLLTVQLLHANGCKVLGLDFDGDRCEIAKQLGAEVFQLSDDHNALSAAQAFSNNQGVDGVLITASTKSNEPVSIAAKMCRKRGRIILVGVAGLELSRADFYEKELSFQVSCSYGPGRYDPIYEQQGVDYPHAFVRWTEQRNFEAFLNLLATKHIDVQPLISHRFMFADAKEAYDVLVNGQRSLGIVLHYPVNDTNLRQNTIALPQTIQPNNAPVFGVIGAGNYASRVLLPAFKKSAIHCKTMATRGGVGAVHFGQKLGFKAATTDIEQLLNDKDIDAVIIATQHNSHAALTIKSINANKHVFVEKPLCLNQVELNAIKAAQFTQVDKILMVGFNRRFAPHIQKAMKLLKNCSAPKHMIMTINAGFIPKEHWSQDRAMGGGRLLGEACHFVDLLRFIAAVPIESSEVMAMDHLEDQLTITLKFGDGSIGVIHYLANGHKSYSKERLEIFVDGKIIVIDNFRKMRGFGFKRFSKMNLWGQDKGQHACAKAFVDGIKAGAAPIPLDEIFEVQQVCLDLVERVRS